MKKIIALLALTIFVSSCSLDDDSNDFTFEFVPIVSVEMPDTFMLNETHQITLNYFRPSTCHGFFDVSFSRDSQLQRTVAVINTVANSADCTELTDELRDFTFDFSVVYTGTYTFRFWQGKDDNGEDLFLIIEVPVIE
ncbi:hypothetical protein ACFQ1M_12705 [Sungkyunkwania multivorans]|uniref:Lipoprotein n=1 Tax=Sungkyunkwania multivorans TaxID=1173618 RepID=A0ABW3D0T1_9FLAO